MSNYTSSIFVAVPVSLLPISQPIAQAFDPDSGGARSFDVIRAEKDGTTYAICYTPAVPATANGLGYFAAVAGALHQYVTADFANRWPDQTPPTLEECETFRTNIVLATGMSLQAALDEYGMTLVVPE